MPDVMHPLAASFRLEGDAPDAYLMLHGWTGSPAHFHPAAEYANLRGHTVLVPRLAGHGTSPHHMIDTGWRDWVRSALEGFLALADEYDRVHLVGLSMGGIISLLLAATNQVASVTTINAPQRLRNRRAHLARLRRGSRDLRPGEPTPAPDPTVAKYWVQYEDSPVGTVGALLDLMDAAHLALPRVTAPTVIIQSRVDETVHPRSADIIYAGLGAADKRIIWLQHSGHVALLDVERERIHEALLLHSRSS